MKVEINHLTKVIQGNVVLDDINACFSCASGENGGRIYGIQGINGSGKTMLMRVICGLVLPTMGTVSIDGEIIGKGISFPRSIGLLLENPIFIDEFTGAKNLSLLCDIKRLVSQAQIGDTLRRVGLNPSDKRAKDAKAKGKKRDCQRKTERQKAGQSIARQYIIRQNGKARQTICKKAEYAYRAKADCKVKQIPHG